MMISPIKFIITTDTSHLCLHCHSLPCTCAGLVPETVQAGAITEQGRQVGLSGTELEYDGGLLCCFCPLPVLSHPCFALSKPVNHSMKYSFPQMAEDFDAAQACSSLVESTRRHALHYSIFATLVEHSVRVVLYVQPPPPIYKILRFQLEKNQQNREKEIHLFQPIGNYSCKNTIFNCGLLLLFCYQYTCIFT